MNRKLSFLSAFEMKPIELFSYFFTINVIITAIASAVIETQVLFFHEILGSVVFCAAPVLALVALNTKSVSKRVDDMENGLAVGLLFHFIMTISIVVFAAVAWHTFLPLHGNGSLGVFIRGNVFAMLQGYAIALLAAKIIDVRKTASANRYLKIIQASKKESFRR